jgi:hypothetical protein
MKYEAELYSKYKQYYGYVFYIGKKVWKIECSITSYNSGLVTLNETGYKYRTVQTRICEQVWRIFDSNFQLFIFAGVEFMNGFTKKDMEEALQTISSMTSKLRKQKKNFHKVTSHIHYKRTGLKRLI